MTDRDVLLERVEVGERVVVVDDVHTQQGLSTADHLLERGRRVEVVSRLFYAGQDVGITSIVPLYTRLFAKGVVFTPHTDLVAVEGSTVVVANVYTGEERRIEGVDTVVLSMGARSTDALYRALRGRVPDLHAVGDCVAPRGVHHAILEGTRVARRPLSGVRPLPSGQSPLRPERAGEMSGKSKSDPGLGRGGGGAAEATLEALGEAVGAGAARRAGRGGGRVRPRRATRSLHSPGTARPGSSCSGRPGAASPAEVGRAVGAWLARPIRRPR